MMLKNLLETLKTLHHINSQDEFAALLARDSELMQQVKTADAKHWVHFTKQTFDGWYCVPTPQLTTFHVYYQERGQNGWGEDVFSNQSEAIAAAIFMSGLWDSEFNFTRINCP